MDIETAIGSVCYSGGQKSNRILLFPDDFRCIHPCHGLLNSNEVRSKQSQTRPDNPAI